MKKMKKLLLSVLSILAITAGTLGMASCGYWENLEQSSSSTPQEVCTAHSWTVDTTMPTCQAQGYDTKTCDVCGKVEVDNYTDIVGHAWATVYSYDETFHWIDCATCKKVKNKKEHTLYRQLAP